MAAALAAATVGALHLWMQGRVASQSRLNTALSREIGQLQAQIQEVKALQTEIVALAELQAARHRPVQLLAELTRLLPDDMHLNSLRQEGRGVTLRGTAPSEDSVSELLRRLTGTSSWLDQPELLEVVGLAATPNQDGSGSGPAARQRVAQFTLRARMPVTVPLVVQQVDPAITGSAP